MNLSASEKMEYSNEYSWAKVLIWAFLFYLVWNWKSMVLLYGEGVLPGPDDFLRLSQVENWISGQSWYDLRAYRIFPPLGADIHWSRFADAPLGLLVVVFERFTDLKTAGRLAAIVWPLILFLTTLSAMVAVCDRIAGKQYRLLALLFFVMSITTLAEFKPGRIDHHNLQILILAFIMLGFVGGLGRFSNYFIGVLISLSVVIGLDLLLIIVAIISFFALEWCFQKEGSIKRLSHLGIGMSLSAFAFYIISFPIDRWLSNNACDAFSLVYVFALVVLSGAFIALAMLSNTNLLSGKAVFFKRAFVGGVFGLITIASIFAIFPNCLEGPLGTIDAELKLRWLDKVVEAKGLIENIAIDPANGITQAIYLGIMLFVMLAVLLKKQASKPELLIIGFIVLICILGAFYQTRILRTGLYAVIPFTVIFIAMSGEWFTKIFAGKKFIIHSIQSVLCVLLTSAFWFIMGAFAPINSDQNVEASDTAELINSTEQPLICTSDKAQAVLASAEKGHVISDLNTATSILIHTNHSVEASSYHRNGRSILNVISFFDALPKDSKKIAEKRKANYVVICKVDIVPSPTNGGQSLASLIKSNQLPQWLDWISKPDATLAILKVRH